MNAVLTEARAVLASGTVLPSELLEQIIGSYITVPLLDFEPAYRLYIAPTGDWYTYTDAAGVLHIFDLFGGDRSSDEHLLKLAKAIQLATDTYFAENGKLPADFWTATVPQLLQS